MSFSDLAHILHIRPYRETSQIISAFSRENGRISLLHKGVKRGGKAPAQPFSLLQLSWSGKSELKTVRSLEVVENVSLSGKKLFLGFYLNELLMRVLRDGQSVSSLFDHYHHLIKRLHIEDGDIEPFLRLFEYRLLDVMGYGFALDVDARNGDKIRSGKHYRYDPSEGLSLVGGTDASTAGASVYSGESLLAMAAMDYSKNEVKIAAKRLMREALRPHLGSKPLKSRELFNGYMGELKPTQ